MAISLGAAGRWVQSLLLALPASVPPDQRVKAETGYRTRGIHRARGWVILTRDRLIFERNEPWVMLRQFFRGPNFEINLREIDTVLRVPGVPFDRIPFMPVIALTLESGEQYFLQMITTGRWIDAIEAARRELTAEQGVQS